MSTSFLFVLFVLVPLFVPASAAKAKNRGRGRGRGVCHRRPGYGVCFEVFLLQVPTGKDRRVNVLAADQKDTKARESQAVRTTSCFLQKGALASSPAIEQSRLAGCRSTGFIRRGLWSRAGQCEA